jgi:hypothetical protein
MRWLLPSATILVFLCSCSSSTSPGASSLTLRDPYWNQVNVQVVITNRSDCDSREEGYVSSKTFMLRKDGKQSIDIPNGANLCWRHDRNPDKPVEGAWSGWTKATLPAGQNSETDL